MRHPTCRILRRSRLLLAAAMLALVWASAAAADSDRGQLRDRLAFMDSRHAPAAQVGAERPRGQAHSRPARGDRSAQGFARRRGSRQARPADRDGELRREDQRLPHRAEQGPGRRRRARLRQGQRRGARPDGRRRRGARAEPRLRRHPRHAPPELRAEGERDHGLRQRRQGERRQERPHHQRHRLAGRLARGRARRDARLSAGQAVVAAKQNVGGAAAPVTSSADELSTRFASGDRAKLVYFQALDGLTLAYKTLLIDDGYLIVVDAGSGKLLYRDSILDSANGLAWTTARVRPPAAPSARTTSTARTALGLRRRSTRSSAPTRACRATTPGSTAT